MNPTSIYRYYDRDGKMIYVGITGAGMIRQTQHNRMADWWRFVSTQEVEHVDTRQDALRRERELIRLHRPPFNKEHNPGWQELRATYLAHVESTDGSCGGGMQCDCWWAGVEEGSTSVQDALAALLGGGDPVVVEATEAARAALVALVDTLRERHNVYAGAVALAIPEQSLINEYATGVSA